MAEFQAAAAIKALRLNLLAFFNGSFPPFPIKAAKG
jgi:hypothetical protein